MKVSSVIYATLYTETMVVTGSFLGGDTTATFASVGSSIELICRAASNEWVILSSNGVTFS